ncbi:signal peptidase I [Gracilinema caldarium]|uniref:Signal peptidase I n=1 Tax=Gracilinema caldarium (strain ATCC 51460 / DSM 7334 / H1) TaxID=744872 RepID=F8F1N1_GRAC1|nr:signal peptidase I [Gracilinema caldarium]AEJ19365.1 signal peptidase I [Gracilinema caldarium DSM 7334]
MNELKKDASLGITILGALFVALLIKILCFDIMIAEGTSMMPTIYPGKVLFINKLAYGFRLPWSKKYILRWNYPRIGDIVVFVSPQGTIAVKRCVQIQNQEYILVLGENSEVSYDSRNYGPISADFVLGRVEGIQ